MVKAEYGGLVGVCGEAGQMKKSGQIAVGCREFDLSRTATDCSGIDKAFL